MDLNGKVKIIYSSDIKFSYRNCSLDSNLIFISATFKGKKDSKQNIQKKINNLIKKLYDTNFFSHIEISLGNGILKISLKENPIIQTLTFKGVKAKKFKEALLERVELKEKSSFVEVYLKSDIQNIKIRFF